MTAAGVATTEQGQPGPGFLLAHYARHLHMHLSQIRERVAQ